MPNRFGQDDARSPIEDSDRPLFAGDRDAIASMHQRKPEESPTVRMEFAKGDHVTIKEGPFENYEGTVDEVLPDKGKVRVLVTIFGRQAPVELEYWQIVKAGE